MKRHPLLLGVALATAALATSAGAAPVTQSRLAVVDTQLALAHGHVLDLTLRLTSANGVRTLRVETRECSSQGCGEYELFSGPAGTSDVSASTAQARLRTVLDGVPVAVTWSPSGGSAVVLGGTDVNGGPDGDTASTYRGDSAVVKVTWGDATCTTEGAVGDEVRVSDSDSAGTAPLSELTLPDGRLAC